MEQKTKNGTNRGAVLCQKCVVQLLLSLPLLLDLILLLTPPTSRWSLNGHNGHFDSWLEVSDTALSAQKTIKEKGIPSYFL